MPLTLQLHDPRFAHSSSFFFPIFLQDTAKTGTALPEMTVVTVEEIVNIEEAEEGTATDMVATGTEEVEGGEGTETGVTGTAVVEDVISKNIPVALRDMMMTVAATIEVLEMMIPVQLLGMTDHPVNVVVEVVAEEEEDGAKEEMEWALQKGGPLHLKVQFLCRREGVKRRVGMSTHQVMNNIQPCRLSKQVG